MHSHLGLQRGLADVREAMTKNGMQLIARKIVADMPVIRRTQSRGLHMFREPRPGELAKYFDSWIEILRAQDRKQRLAEIVSAEALDRAVSAGEPAVAIAAEGARVVPVDGSYDDAVRRSAEAGGAVENREDVKLG